MAGKVVSGPFRLQLERTFEGNRFAQEYQGQAFDFLLEPAEPLDDTGSIQPASLSADSKEGVAA